MSVMGVSMWWCVVCSLLCSAYGLPSISEVNILLPYTHTELPYRLTATGGCFKWKSRNTDIVVVKAIVGNGGCSDSADIFVSPSLVFKERVHTWVEV
jgi:hypothetical protein